MSQQNADIAIVDNRREYAEERQRFIEDKTDWLAVVRTEIFTNADDLIDAVETGDKYYDVIITDVFMPKRGDDMSSEGTPGEGAIRIKEWLQKKREGDSDFRRVQLRWISRVSDVSDFIHRHITMENYSWLRYLTHHDKKPFKFEFQRMVDEAIRMANPGIVDIDLSADFWAASPAMIDVIRQAISFAKSNANILITGPTGTGKELLAKYIHNKSSRSDKPRISINCAAIPETLLESELFGYERGAFTGAQNKRHGIFHYANGGTLFLDEVGEMSLGMQAKLLRVLQDKEFSPVGGDYSKPEKSDFRLICATHKDLQQEMQAEHFRSDLYYRIRVLELKIPSLKDRPEDITFLAKQFSQKFAKEYEKGLILISNDAMDILKQYHWPGNIRELENIIEGAVISVPMNGTVEVTHLPPEFQPDSSKIQVPGTLTPEEQKRWEVLKAHSFNIPKAANALGISRQGFHKYINDHPMLMRIYSREKELMDARIKHPKSSAKVGHTELPPAPSIKIEDKF